MPFQLKRTKLIAGLGAAGMAVAFSLTSASAGPSAYVALDGQIRLQSGAAAGTNDWGNSGTTYDNNCTAPAGATAGTGINAVGTGGLFNCGAPNATAGHAPIAPPLVSSDTTIDASTFLVDPLANQGRSDLGNACIGSGTSDLDPTTYTNSTKNGDPLNTYTYGPGTNTPKDDLANVYAIARSGEVFFAAERVINNGDSHMDFEFLQASLGTTASTKTACSGSFNGHRSQGDFLLSADFPGNPTPPTRTTHEWHCLIETVAAAPQGFICDPGTTPTSTQCSALGLPGPGRNTACTNDWSPHYQDISGNDRDRNAIFFTTNPGSIPCGGWVCRDEMQTDPHVVSQDEFMEGGVNLASLGFTGCVSTFLPHTRSSSSFTAQLKDFGGPVGFHTCSINTTATAASGSHTAGASIGDSATVDGFSGAPGVVKFDLYRFAAGTDPATVTSTSCTATNHVDQFAGSTSDTTAPATYLTSVTVNNVTTSGNVYTASTPGLYEWVASYFATSSATTPEVVSACGAEPWAINQSTPDLTTSPTPSSTVDITGLTGPLNDSAAVGSLSHPGSNPADATGTGLGKVTFKLYGPFTSAPGATDCVDTGTGANIQSAATTTVSGTNVTTGSLAGISANYSTGFTTGHGFTPTSPGWYQWVASYAGNTANASTAGACGDTTEQVRLVDAYVTLTPATGTNVVGNDHVLTATVHQNDGSGWVLAPDNTTVSFSFVTPPANVGTLTATSCLTSNSTGSCTTTDQSSTAGTDTIRASISVSVGGITLTRHTGDSLSSDSIDATKIWVSPYTLLTVYDQLAGLGSGATGTVNYKAYTSSALCAADGSFTNTGAGIASEGSTTTITSGTAAKSSDVQIGPGTTWGTTIYWRAQYVGSGTGNEGTFISGCTESAVSS